ncbi:MAG: cysteine desulfurase family protein [bacterium]|nr:cysteine desulfurase family protein [bacterium]
MNRIYLDYAASTPVAPEVLCAMEPYFSEKFGNPSSLHWFGQEASAAIFRARETIVQALGCHYKEIVFTGTASEANNLAIRGIAQRSKETKKQRNKTFQPQIITSTIEHESVLETCRALECEGAEVIYIPVNREGLVDLKKLKVALNDRTVLVSIMHANNETGVVQPIAEIGKMLAEFRSAQGAASYPLFHSDAAQSFQYLPCRVDELGVDLLTLSGQKMYGPKGVGALYIRKQGSNKATKQENEYLAPIITGSGQEWGLRAGTENTPLIVGFGAAVALAEKLRNKESARVSKLRDYFLKRLRVIAPKAELNGSLTERLPNNINVYFPGHSAGDMVIALDVQGIAASPGAACRSRAAKESYVIRAMGYSADRASQSVRFSLGRQTRKRDIDKAFLALARIMK